MSPHHLTKKQLADAASAADTNNNEEKYSLRRKRKANHSLDVDCDDGEPTGKKGKGKSKPKAAPLSKYRRKTANARERTRMREINTAFETLRTFVPLVVSGVPANEPSTNEKLTKITTLRLAMKYIKILDDILKTPSETAEVTFGSIIDSIHNVASPTEGVSHHNNNDEDHNYNSTDWYGTCKASSYKELSAHSVYDSFDKIMLTPQPPPTPTTPAKTNNNKKSNKTNTTKTSKSSKKKTKAPPANATSKTAKQTKKTNKTTTTPKRSQPQVPKNQPSLAKIMKHIDLTPCLALSNSSFDDFSLDLDLPLEAEVPSLHLSGLDHMKLRETYNCKANNYSDSLELGLLLESDGESLNMSEPCLSPLSQLDSFNPFNDLLHTDFNEQAALEMFLT